MPRFERSYDPDRPGQVLSQHGEPVALVVWTHDFGDRAQTGWFLITLDDEGEPDGRPAGRLQVADEIDELVADAQLDRAAWIARAETLELVTAPAAVAAGEQRLATLLDGTA